jgi:hypothetical protein
MAAARWTGRYERWRSSLRCRQTDETATIRRRGQSHQPPCANGDVGAAPRPPATTPTANGAIGAGRRKTKPRQRTLFDAGKGGWGELLLRQKDRGRPGGSRARTSASPDTATGTARGSFIGQRFCCLESVTQLHWPGPARGQVVELAHWPGGGAQAAIRRPAAASVAAKDRATSLAPAGALLSCASLDPQEDGTGHPPNDVTRAVPANVR